MTKPTDPVLEAFAYSTVTYCSPTANPSVPVPGAAVVPRAVVYEDTGRRATSKVLAVYEVSTSHTFNP